MQVSLTTDLERFVDEQLASGNYATRDDVLQAAVALLRQSERFGDFATGELDVFLAEGERSLESKGGISADDVFDEIRRRSADRRMGHP